MKTVYLFLAIVGAVVPYAFFADHAIQSGLSPALFLQSTFANPAASGFVVDLLISSAVFWVAIYRLHKRQNGPAPWPFLALNLTIGLSCALPAYFYAREK